MGYHLVQRGLRFLIVEIGPSLGHEWRSGWDSLQLFTSGRYDDLPGLPFPTAADAYPVKDEVADFPQAYAAAFELPVRLGTTVTSLACDGDGSDLVKAGRDAVEAGQSDISRWWNQPAADPGGFVDQAPGGNTPGRRTPVAGLRR